MLDTDEWVIFYSEWYNTATIYTIGIPFTELVEHVQYTNVGSMQHLRCKSSGIANNCTLNNHFT